MRAMNGASRWLDAIALIAIVAADNAKPAFASWLIREEMRAFVTLTP
jgi:hypothetical protein